MPDLFQPGRHHEPRKRIDTGMSIGYALSKGAAELLRALVLPTSDPRHVCGPECFAEHLEH